MQSGVCDLRGLISGFFGGCWLVFFHIAILLGESLLFFAPMFSFVIGWQSSSKFMGNEVNAHTALIHPQFLWDLETVLALDYVVCPFVCSFLAWFVLLTGIPTICYSLPWFIWLFLSLVRCSLRLFLQCGLSEYSHISKDKEIILDKEKHEIILEETFRKQN